MDAVDAYRDRTALMEALNNDLDELDRSVLEVADAERDFKREYALKLLELEKVPATVRGDIAYADERVLEERHRRDAAKSVEKALYESINVRKLQLRVVQEDIQQHWRYE